MSHVFGANLADASSFSQRTRLALSAGYNFGQHSTSHYVAAYGAPNTSTLRYARHRAEGRIDISWSGFWKWRQGKQGLYLRSAPSAFGGGSIQGSLNDKDFCDNSGLSNLTTIAGWQCPQALTTWSDTSSSVNNWFLGAEIDNTIGFFLQNPSNNERFFGLGFSFGYSFLYENDLAQGLTYNIDLIPPRQPIGELLYQGENVIGNALYWHAAKVGLELWTEQIPHHWQQPIVLNISANFLPYATFLEEDSHFLRVGANDFAPIPNIASAGLGKGVEVKGSLFVPLPTAKAPHVGLVLQARWRKLFLNRGTKIFYYGDGSDEDFPLTEFTTESFAVSTGVTMAW